MKAVVAAFNLEKALVEALSVITNLRMDLFEALVKTPRRTKSWICHNKRKFSTEKIETDRKLEIKYGGGNIIAAAVHSLMLCIFPNNKSKAR